MRTLLTRFLFPPVCPGCGLPVRQEGMWCEDCFKELFLLRRIDQWDESGLTEIIILGRYDKGLKHLLQDIKFRHQKERAYGAAPFLHAFSLLSPKAPDYVVPIPVSDRKLRERGFNQVELLFADWVQAQHEACRQSGWVWCDCLVKLDHTLPMWHLSGRERRINMEGAFLMKKAWRKEKSFLTGKAVLLVDVMTLGLIQYWERCA